MKRRRERDLKWRERELESEREGEGDRYGGERKELMGESLRWEMREGGYR